jgi:hypothetical protein
MALNLFLLILMFIIACLLIILNSKYIINYVEEEFKNF